MNIDDINKLLITRQVIIQCPVSAFDLICDNKSEYQEFLENLQQLLNIEPGVVYLNNIYQKLLILLSDQRNKYRNSNIIETTNSIIRHINSLINYSQATLNDQKCIYVQNQCVLRFGNPIVIEYLKNFNRDESNALLSKELLTSLAFDRNLLLDLQQFRVSINIYNLLYYISSLSYLTANFKDYLTDAKTISFIDKLSTALQKIILELKKINCIDKLTYKSCMDVFNNMSNEKNDNHKSKIKTKNT